MMVFFCIITIIVLFIIVCLSFPMFGKKIDSGNFDVSLLLLHLYFPCLWVEHTFFCHHYNTTENVNIKMTDKFKCVNEGIRPYSHHFHTFIIPFSLLFSCVYFIEICFKFVFVSLCLILGAYKTHVKRQWTVNIHWDLLNSVKNHADDHIILT